ncbi:hypothetical protein SADUNF_Sadunf02G0153600 [Salix dunnii]|uniref:Uncharacterized protein n=1 Tax=Salix dunnii TaxID=1413687 RepID=A0A835THE2_9ROSI|nr:hypothetical protein SADUNF_Sadunf02G0153600 [Salix dunnii]
MEVNLRVSSFGCLCPFLVLIIFFEYLITPLNLWCEMVFYALTIKDKSLLLKRNEGEWGFFHELFFNCFNIPRDACMSLLETLCLSVLFFFQ